jgi:hypothetical protein
VGESARVGATAIGGVLLGLALGIASATARPWALLAITTPMPHLSSGLHVIPFPGTPDASPSSGVIFTALRRGELRSVIVTGSTSGPHSGRLITLPDGAGAEFAPDHRFNPGELVHVSARLTDPAAGTASGDPNATQLEFSFRVGRRVRAIRPDHGPRGTARTGIGPTQHFQSESHLRPPVITVTGHPDHTSGDIFLAMQNSPQVGPMIMNGHGQLVWFHPIGTGSGALIASDLEVQHYQGRPVLTWWQGVPLGSGEDLLVDQSYRTVAVVHAGDGYLTDFHEFQVTPQGTALLDAWEFVRANLTSVGGPPNGVVLDNIIQEIDIKTGKLLWEWHALGHVPLTASYYPYVAGEPFYDYFHLNSIQQLPNGNLLISARHTWAVYEISRKTGKVVWTLGGKYSNFAMGPGTNFEWQHDARLHGHTLSLFDDGASPPEERQSSAKYLKVDLHNRRVTLIRRFTHSPPLLTGAAGSAQRLPNGNLFVGWGELPEFTEFTASGQQIFNGSFALGLTSYRAFRFPWVARPRTRPSLAVSRRANGLVRAYASWNGATQVAAWRMLGGSKPHSLRPLGTTAMPTGFQTTIEVTRHPKYFAVQALGRNGKVLSTSAPVQGRNVKRG